jgi:hypothetical protein
MLGGSLRPGSAYLLDLLGFEEHLAGRGSWSPVRARLISRH